MNSPSTSSIAATASVVEDIRDIRPPIHIPNGWLWAAYVTGALAVAGIAWLIWRRRTHPERVKQADERALEQLEQARLLMQPDTAYAFSVLISEIIRHYIEERFRARAAHRTTEEFLHDLLGVHYAALAGYRFVLADFLEHCDLAKFARWQLSVPEMEALHESARAFVIETGKPVEPVAELQPVHRRRPR